jgi:hypothetical protein
MGLLRNKNSLFLVYFCAIADGNPDIEERILYNDKVNMD